MGMGNGNGRCVLFPQLALANSGLIRIKKAQEAQTSIHPSVDKGMEREQCASPLFSSAFAGCSLPPFFPPFASLRASLWCRERAPIPTSFPKFSNIRIQITFRTYFEIRMEIIKILFKLIEIESDCDTDVINKHDELGLMIEMRGISKKNLFDLCTFFSSICLRFVYQLTLFEFNKYVN